MTLHQLGWHPFFEAYATPFRAQGYLVGRIAIQYRDRYVLYTDRGEVWGEISGKFRYNARSKEDFPAVGDWVIIEAHPNEDFATIHRVLQRRTKFSRKVAGEDLEEQIIAANIDVVFAVMGLDGDYNLRRLERYLTVAWDSGATPVIVLNKADLVEETSPIVAEVHDVAHGTDIVVTSAKKHEGLQVFCDRLKTGVTGVLIGSSGVGKSTIINALLGTEHLRTQEVREDDSRGRHTTTHRELLFLPSGGMLIDSPGIRELQLWGSEAMLDDSFDDIAELAQACKFRDCTHEHEPNCEVQRALAEDRLAEDRWKSYLKLRRELKFLERKVDTNAARKEKEYWKKLSRVAKLKNKRKGL